MEDKGCFVTCDNFLCWREKRIVGKEPNECAFNASVKAGGIMVGKIVTSSSKATTRLQNAKAITAGF